jgi:oligoribonuclease NrnB/cAMP/cGMP phosphodiesterase (DHH superfamily)
MQIYVLYHKNCTDGFGAAFAAWKKFNDKAQYLPISHMDPVPTFDPGATVYVVDFCFPKKVIEELVKDHTVITLDHHISSEEAIKSSSDYLYDLHRSGAKLAWDYFHPNTTNQIIEYISDKDLGLFNLFKSREVISSIESYPRDFKIWDNFNVEQLILEGNSILRAKNIEVNYAADRVEFEKIGGFNVPCVNSPIYMSEIAEVLLDKYPEEKFVAIFYEYEMDGEKFRKYSLRSKMVDVNSIAAKYSGGGHKISSAFIVKISKDGKHE